MYGVCLVSPARKEGQCSGIPAGYSLTHSLYLWCMPRQRNCVDMPLLTAGQGSCPKKTNGSRDNADFPWRNGGGRPHAQGSNPTREKPGTRLPIGEPRLWQREQWKSPCPRRTESAKPPESEGHEIFLWCGHKKRIFLRKRHGRNMHGSMEEGRKDARGASTDLDHGKKATRTKRSGPPLHPVSAL